MEEESGAAKLAFCHCEERSDEAISSVSYSLYPLWLFSVTSVTLSKTYSLCTVLSIIKGLADVKREEILQQVRSVVASVAEKANVQVYLFGSWARGEERVTSDIDLAIEGEDASEMAMQVREALEESNIPYRVDVVNLVEASPELLANVRKEGILWKGCLKK